jgi:hypothetical protein
LINNLIYQSRLLHSSIRARTKKCDTGKKAKDISVHLKT